LQDREVELDLVGGLRLGGRRQVGGGRELEGVRGEAPIVGVLDLADDRLRARAEKPMPVIQRGEPLRSA